MPQWTKQQHKEDHGYYSIYTVTDHGGVRSEYATTDMLREFFGDRAEASDLCFCMFSTSGVHGSYLNLDDLEESFAKGLEDYDAEEGEVPSLTFLIIQPRIVQMRYGNVLVERDDIPYLRALARSSAAAFTKSQEGNT